MFNYKGIRSNITFGTKTNEFLRKVIDLIYNYFNINDVFPEFEIIIHPNYQNNLDIFPETRNGIIMLCTNICDNKQYDYYQQITWQFSHELVHACKGFKEDRNNWKYLPDDDEEEILAGGIAIRIIKDMCPNYPYWENYKKLNLKQCEEKAESLKDYLHIKQPKL